MADEMNDLQSHLDSLLLRGGISPDRTTIDQLAADLKGQLKLNLDDEAYRKLASELAHMSLSRPIQGGSSVVGGTPTKISAQNLTAEGSPAFSNRNQNIIYNQNGSPAPQIQRPSPHRRGRSPARADLADSSTARANPGFRGNSPIRNFWGGVNKIPPGATDARNTAKASSPAFQFLRRAAQKSPEEKKEDVKLRTRDDSPGASPTRARPQRSLRDTSPGASPTRPSTKRAASPMPQQGSVFPPAPPQTFQPPSTPIRPPVSSRPTTPVNTSSNRPPSRSSSPYSSRPGLQEDDDESVASMSVRSPGRSFMNNSHGISSANNNSDSIGSVTSSGMSSQPRPLPVFHRRSGSIDTEVVRKPIPPRALSNSPMHRPSARMDDDGGDHQPAPPRAFSRSPQGRSTTYFDGPSSNNDQIQIPDLAIPGLGPSADGDSMFTPPQPRAFPPSQRQTTYRDNEEASLNGRTQPVARFGLAPRFDNNPGGFQFGSAPIGLRRPRANKANGAAAPPPRGEEVFSPMDVDAVTPARNDIVFNMGKSNPNPQRPKPRRAVPHSDVPLPRSTENSYEYDAPAKTVDAKLAQAANPNVDFYGQLNYINAKREEGKHFYMSGDFRSSILSYTEAIKLYKSASTGLLTSDTVAVLLSNRAACLLMIGAFDAAVEDCVLALQNVTMPRAKEPFSNDSGLLLKIKLHTRLARGYLQLGNHIEAHKGFTDAIATADEASAFSKANHPLHVYQQHQPTITHMTTEATLGQGDAKRLRDSLDKLSKITMESLSRNLSERSKYAEMLTHVNIALAIASGSLRLIENKVTLLVQMKRWREAAGYLERLAALNVRLDGVFVEDLASKSPFPGILPAQSLKVDFFEGKRDEDAATKDLKLNTRASAEAVLRLPYELTQTYIRALRLEERYPCADACLRALEDLMRRGNGVHEFHHLNIIFGYLSKERSKLKRTKDGREKGDELFRCHDYELAASEYAACLKIDAEGAADALDGANAGGRLHAVLHCNRAACLMALRRYHGAVEECTSALKIHARYMKAILRRARCYSRLQRTQEAIAEYRRWLDLVEDAKKSGVPLSPCLFDGPNDMKPAEVRQTEKELDDIIKAKRRAEATAREEADRRREREQNRFHDGFSSAWRSGSAAGTDGGGTAQQRRDKWYNQHSSEENRHWDSFSNRGPRSSSIPRNRANYGARSSSNPRASSQGRAPQDPQQNPGAQDEVDHYTILELPQNASADDIKKSFRKLALKYHPDKNKDEGAIDIFRRVKLAHETLCDPVKRRDYDAQLRLQRSGTF